MLGDSGCWLSYEAGGGLDAWWWSPRGPARRDDSRITAGQLWKNRGSRKKISPCHEQRRARRGMAHRSPGGYSKSRRSATIGGNGDRMKAERPDQSLLSAVSLR